jgi:hypothetical protein
MKRLLFLLMTPLAILVITVGIVEAQSWHGGVPVAHIVLSALFILLLIVHNLVQRKAVGRYISGSGKLPSDPRQKMRQIMRRVTVYLMLVSGLLTIISGIISVHTPGRSVFHIVMAALFVLFFVRHLLANRKAIRNYFITAKKEPIAVVAPDIEDSID